MRIFDNEELSQRLSEYLDGTLDPAMRRELEDYIAAHPEAEGELQDLKKVRSLLSGQKRLAPDPYFWSRLSARMNADAEEEKNLLPFPRKYIPYASAMGILAVFAVGMTMFLQREAIFKYMSERSQAVKEVYETGILKGAVLPLFAGIDNDKVLQFALFGTLPLDEKEETALRVDEESAQGYHIEIGMTADRPSQAVTVKDLYRDVRPTSQQERMIDSVLEQARAQIAKGGFYAENNALALDPNLTKLSRVVLSNITSVLAPAQRQRFSKFLTKQKAAYAIAETDIHAPAEPNQWKYRERAGNSGSNEFVVITPDSFVVTRLALNIDSLLKPELFDMPAVARELPARLENLMRARFERSGGADVVRPRATPHAPVQAFSDQDFFKIEISPQFFPDPESMRVWVTPNINKEKVFRFEYRVDSRGVTVGGSAVIVEPGAVVDLNGIDSMRRAVEKQREQFRNLDSLVRLKVRPVQPVEPRIRNDTTSRR